MSTNSKKRAERRRDWRDDWRHTYILGSTDRRELSRRIRREIWRSQRPVND